MAMVFSSMSRCQAPVSARVGAINPKLQSRIHCQSCRQSKSYTGIQVPFGRKSQILMVQHFLGKKCTLAGGRNRNHLTVDDDYYQEPFWSNLTKEAFRAIKSLLIFLVEQPSQLKHIEWPGFQSTLKTATLSLVLVGLFIVALSSVDSALCYILSLLLSRRA
ncbi:hypothetical protein M9H77_33787 [Catharanthus roseus]|uniref:Uncharacterized protein n=1 Tax=Catharanthus roseus TaxID=4058 RepID=A0ACB9ZJF0_CATRO|nr:hypothetical protein M9H77_33787 [Catharanthus roseus]